MPRNLDRKREYDRVRYNKLRKNDLAGTRGAERLRKAAQRARARKSKILSGDRGSATNPFSTDTSQGLAAADKQAFEDWQRNN